MSIIADQTNTFKVIIANEYFQKNANEHIAKEYFQKMQTNTFKVIANEYLKKNAKFIKISRLIMLMFRDVVTGTMSMRMLMTCIVELLGRPGRRRRG